MKKLPVTDQLINALAELDIPELTRRGMPKHTLYRILRGEIDYLNLANTEKLAMALHLSFDQLWRLATANNESESDLKESSDMGCARCETLDKEAIEVARRYQRLPERWRGKLEIRLDDIEYDFQVKRIWEN